MASLAVPNLPGFRSNKPTTTLRPQNFTINKDGIPVEKHPPKRTAAAAEDPTLRFTRSAALAESQATGAAAARAAKATAAAAAAQPAFVALDRQVLRLYAYFKEAVVESATEAERVRKCTIQFFLVDGTIMVIEHKEENSGIPQGTFIKRHRIPGGTGADGSYDFNDLMIGNEVTFYGRTMRIVDCDPFTREFFEANGLELGPPEAYPTDDHTTLRLTSTVSGGDSGYFGKQNNPLKKFMEASLGKVAVGRGEAENLQQFLKNDRMVLRFFCTWDDTKRLYGDKNAFVINYFLADDTVEVREVPVLNSGRDKFPMLLGKQKLPKDWKKDYANDAARGVEDDPPASAFVRPTDLRVGGTVDVFGRELNIIAVDKATRQWYRKNLGYEQPANIKPPSNDKAPVKMPVPPYTGFGEDEDSLSSCVSLIPKAPKKDFNKFMKNEGKVLRFSARLARACPEDRHRSFIIQLYLADDTLAIYEPSIRNSGIGGGKFLNRNKYKKDNGEVYKATDFTPGTEIAIYKRRFFIVDADAYTKEMIPSLIPAAFMPSPALAVEACAKAIHRVRESARAKGAYGLHAIKQSLRKAAAASGGTVSDADLAAAFAGAKLSAAELNAISTSLDKDAAGGIVVDDVVQALQGAMNHRRLALCHAAYDVLDKAGAGVVKVDDMIGAYDFSQNERVLAGEQSIMEAAEEFVAQWDPTTVASDGLVTRDEFLDFSKGLSATVDSDDYYQLMMKKAWRI